MHHCTVALHFACPLLACPPLLSIAPQGQGQLSACSLALAPQVNIENPDLFPGPPPAPQSRSDLAGVTIPAHHHATRLDSTFAHRDNELHLCESNNEILPQAILCLAALQLIEYLFAADFT